MTISEEDRKAFEKLCHVDLTRYSWNGTRYVWNYNRLIAADRINTLLEGFVKGLQWNSTIGHTLIMK